MTLKAASVAEYLAGLPPDRRAAVAAVREVILQNLDKDIAEGMQYGMIGYFVPHSVYPAGYHCDPKQPLPFACLASQKNHLSLYLMSVYGIPEEEKWLRDRFAAAGKTLDMGKCCIRFKSLDDLPLEVIGEAFRRVTARRHIEFYEASVPARNRSARSATTGTKAAARPSPKTSTGSKRKSASRRPSKTAGKKSSGRSASRRGSRR